MNSDIRYGCVVNLDDYNEEIVEKIKEIAAKNGCVFINKHFDRFFLILTENNIKNSLISGVDCYSQIKAITSNVLPIRVTDL